MAHYKKEFMESKKDEIIQLVNDGVSFYKIHKAIIQCFDVDVSYSYVCLTIREWMPWLEKHPPKKNKYKLYLEELERENSNV